MVTIIALIGQLIQGRVDGVLIDERNMISLSRLQIVLWSIVVLSSIVTFVGARAQTPELDPLNIKIPETLWVLMSISTATLVGSPLIRSATQTNKNPNLGEVLPNLRRSQLESRSRTALPRNRTEISEEDEIKLTLIEEDRETNGNVLKNTHAKNATWLDMFRGELVSNSSQVDMAKLQNFFFTVFLAMVYIGAILQYLSRNTIPDTLPEVSDSMVTLLGISHAGYLMAKGLQTSPQENKT